MGKICRRDARARRKKGGGSKGWPPLRLCCVTNTDAHMLQSPDLHLGHKLCDAPAGSLSSTPPQGESSLCQNGRYPLPWSVQPRSTAEGIRHMRPECSENTCSPQCCCPTCGGCAAAERFLPKQCVLRESESAPRLGASVFTESLTNRPRTYSTLKGRSEGMGWPTTHQWQRTRIQKNGLRSIRSVVIQAFHPPANLLKLRLDSKEMDETSASGKTINSNPAGGFAIPACARWPCRHRNLEAN
jgi:hypothetical protein